MPGSCAGPAGLAQVYEPVFDIAGIKLEPENEVDNSGSARILGHRPDGSCHGTVERGNRTGRHGAIMKYDLNRQAAR